nr:12030_t:CDS:2 [Entrophospora candida]
MSTQESLDKNIINNNNNKNYNNIDKDDSGDDANNNELDQTSRTSSAMISKFIIYSFLSGTFAALASVFGKLSTDTKTLKILCSNIMNNKYYNNYYVHFKNAILGYLIFGELLNLQWWLGASLIVIGTAIVLMNNHSDNSNSDNNNDNIDNVVRSKK